MEGQARGRGHPRGSCVTCADGPKHSVSAAVGARRAASWSRRDTPQRASLPREAGGAPGAVCCRCHDGREDPQNVGRQDDLGDPLLARVPGPQGCHQGRTPATSCRGQDRIGRRPSCPGGDEDGSQMSSKPMRTRSLTADRAAWYSGHRPWSISSYPRTSAGTNHMQTASTIATRLILLPPWEQSDPPGADLDGRLTVAGAASRRGCPAPPVAQDRSLRCRHGPVI